MVQLLARWRDGTRTRGVHCVAWRCSGSAVRVCLACDCDKAESDPAGLETGVVARTMGPEVRAQALFRDRFVGVVRIGHPVCRGAITPTRYGGGRHILVSRRGQDKGPIDTALQALGLTRNILAIVGGFSAALALARGSDLIASVPERHTGNLRDAMFSFPLPVATPEITVSLFWHSRLHANSAHQWLRGCVRGVCA